MLDLSRQALEIASEGLVAMQQQGDHLSLAEARCKATCCEKLITRKNCIVNYKPVCIAVGQAADGIGRTRMKRCAEQMVRAMANSFPKFQERSSSGLVRHYSHTCCLWSRESSRSTELATLNCLVAGGA